MVAFTKSENMRHPHLKSVSLLLVAAFLLQDIAQAAPAALPSRDIVHSPHLLKISPSAATVREVHKGSQPRLLIHIQDAHANLSSQENTAKVLDELFPVTV